MRNWLIYAFIGLGLAVACHKQQNIKTADILLDQVNHATLNQIRLGDGVPLNVQLSVRWHIDNLDLFKATYGSPKRFDSLILYPRQNEIVSQISNGFEDVDEVFGTERDTYIAALKGGLSEQLADDGISIKEVIVSSISFPAQYTEVKEKIGMQEQKMALIENEKLLSIRNAQAQEERAKAEGSVRIAQAKMDGDVSKINAETEKLTRLNTLAKAQTQAEVTKLNAKAEAERQKLMAGAEAERQRQLAAVDLEKQQKLKDQDVKKVKDMDELAYTKEKDLASLCANNPKYASFLISKELASKVQIAVLPSEDGGIFNSMLQQQMVDNR